MALAVGIVGGLLLCEGLVRVFSPQTLVSDVIVGDPDVDYRLRPNATGHMSSPEYSADIRVNSNGFRGAPILRANRRPVRVLVLGDSFTFGHGLAEEDTLPVVVEQELERASPGTYEVINGGVYGYSTGDQLNLLKKFGLSVEPDIVVTLLILDDMVENLADYRLTEDGSLERLAAASQYTNSRWITQFIPGASWLRANSHLFKFVGVRVLPVVAAGMAPAVNADSDQEGAVHVQAMGSDPYLAPEFYADKRGAAAVTTALLKNLAATAREHGASSLLLTLGGSHEIADGHVVPGSMTPHAHLARAALESGFANVVALPPLLAGCQTTEALFYPEDGHWTAAATKCVAPMVSAEIASAVSAEH
jgi:hypothetical protein